MRILYLGGSKSWHNQKWLEYFIENGHEVHLLSRSSDQHVIQHDVRMHHAIKIHFVEEITKIAGLRLFLTLPRALYTIRDLVRKLSPDVIHAQGLRHYGLWGALSGFHPFVVTPIGTEQIIYARQNVVDKYLAKVIYRHADALTGDSEVLLKSAVETGMSADKCFLIQNGVDRRMFKKSVDRAYLKQRLGLSQSMKIVLSPRALTPIYNIDVILRAIPRIIEAMAEVHFVFMFAFGGEQKRGLVQLSEQLGISKYVTFLGYVPYDEMPKCVAGADVVVSVPSSDSSPRSVYEAMAVGRPCVLSDLPWTKKHIVHRKHALLVPHRSPRATAEAVLELLKGSEPLDSLIHHAEVLVRDYCDYEDNMKSMGNIYSHLIV